MAAAGVVEAFDPLEDRRGELRLGWPSVARSSSSRCMVDQNDSISALSTQEATRPIEPSSPACAQPVAEDPGRVLGCRGRSARSCRARGGGCQRAICRASTTSSVRMWSAIDQPTTRRENTSSTARSRPIPSLVRCSVMSVTPQPVRAVGDEPALHQVLVRRRRRPVPPRLRRWQTPASPAARISRATRLRPHAERRARAAARRGPAARRRSPRDVGVDVDGSCRSDRRRRRRAPTAAGRATRSSPSARHLSTRQATATANPSAASSLDQPEPYFGSTFSRAK